jgi:flagellar basal-body rod modification protein FlgD
MSTVGLDTILQTQAAQTANTSSSKTADAAATEKNMFLKLLCKQLQYQDPLKPVENTEFASQLAQFSSLEALSNMESSINTMTSYQNSMNSIQTVSFIGKQINSTGNSINYTSGSTSSLNFNLGSTAADVTVTIYNSDGTTVRTIDMGAVTSGDATCTWDGKDNSGASVSGGAYKFKVKATDISGAAVTATTKTKGTVTGIKYVNGSIYLEVGDKTVSLSDVTEITN